MLNKAAVRWPIAIEESRQRADTVVVSAVCEDPAWSWKTTVGASMSFGFKTSWLAVPDAGPEEVADALDLQHRQCIDWETGTELAYQQGVFVARPVPEWTLAHGRIHLSHETDATRPDFPDWLLALAARIGDFQYFATDRIGEYHAWAKVELGELTRAYCYIGMSGDVPLRLGEPTAIERELGVGLVGCEEIRQDWGDAEWDAWHDAMPTEHQVMRIAADWSVCPPLIEDGSVTAPGIHGFPPGVEPGRAF
ncbi:hypothetical protein [Streptomyces pseudovenezuelae]|uniref:hypothetical protein n=1 Tax=Streptomyces pseudovenezuelae TaxID=67350 RepID=UPI002E809921|nr:hypothetical protein [Streptomyces pseudovenezuelae]WUA93665.1 hypothetical protein OHO81_42805 [Streptomyces pseudovenezuelae]